MEYEQKILEIASKIRELRKLRNMTIQELAYHCEIERSNMSRIEAGKTNVTIRTLCKICNALGVELSSIIK